MLNIKAILEKSNLLKGDCINYTMKLPGRNENDAPITFLIFEKALPKYVVKSARSPEYSEKIENECINLKKINSFQQLDSIPNIAYSGKYNECAYFIMPYLSGKIKTVKEISCSDFSLPFTWLENFQIIVKDKHSNKNWSELNPEKEWSTLFYQKEADAKKYFEIISAISPPFMTLIHGDFNLYNILWNNNNIHIIDWEYSRKGYSYFDPCFCLAQYILDLYGKRNFIGGMQDLYRNKNLPFYDYMLSNLIFMPLFLQDILEFNFGLHSFPLQDEKLLKEVLKFEINRRALDD
jgi:hypothetical protein